MKKGNDLYTKKSIVYVACIIEELSSGYNEKIHSQCFAFHNLGFQVYLYISRVDRCVCYEVNKGRMIEIFQKKYSFPFVLSSVKSKNIFEIFQKKYCAYLRIREFFKNLYEMNLSKKSQIIYIRRVIPITNILIEYLKKLKRNGKTIIYEYPTYPWEKEMINGKNYFLYILDKYYYKKLISLVDYVPVILGKKINLSEKFIKIRNGINAQNITTKKYNHFNDEFNMIGLGHIRYWHGYDRVIKGISNYYSSSNIKKRVYFHIVGDEKEIPRLKELVKKYKIEKYILFYGHKEGNDLNNIFDLCHVAIGSLGNHRQGLDIACPLKNREYCARGIPFIISFNDLDFPEDFPYIKKIPANDSAVNIEEIINFYINIEDKFPNYIENIKNYAEKNLSWEIKLKPVVDVLNIKL